MRCLTYLQNLQRLPFEAGDWLVFGSIAKETALSVNLLVLDGKHEGLMINLPRRAQFMIGRDPKCHLRPASTDVSRYHCVIARRTGVTHVCDLQSANGTFVNDEQIGGTVRLRDGDVLRVGPLRFRVLIDDRPDSIAPSDSEWLSHEPAEQDKQVLDPALDTALHLPSLLKDGLLDEPDNSDSRKQRPVEGDRAAVPGDSLRATIRRRKSQ